MAIKIKFDIHVYHHHVCNKAPPRPPAVSVASKRQIDMATFGLKVTLPAPGAVDVTQRQLTITVNGGDPPTLVTLPGTALITEEMVFNADDELVMTLVDIDAAGNPSPPSAAFSYDVIDDVPPPQPGDLGVTDKRQID